MASVTYSNTLYNQLYPTDHPFSVKFTYTMAVSTGDTSVQNDGFSIFFVNTPFTSPSLSGGGSGPGLGLVSSTDNSSSLSAVSGVFAAIGFDVLGNYTKINSIPGFTTGIDVNMPKNITLRLTPNFIFKNNIMPVDQSIFAINTPVTLKMDVSNQFKKIEISKLYANNFSRIASFELSDLNSTNDIPENAYMGISYSGDTSFNVSNVCLNYS